MSNLIFANKKEDRRKGILLSVAFHLVLVLLALMPFFTYPDPPPGQEGIVVNLGIPNVGQGSENAGPPAQPEPQRRTSPPPAAKPEKEAEDPTPEKETQEVEQNFEKTVTTEDPEAIALENERQRQAEQEAKRLREEQERAAQAEAERKAKEEAERLEDERKRQEADDLKNEVSGLFGSGTGKGGKTSEGNEGDPDGDPDAKRLEGISAGGSGKVGGGLSNRGIMGSPEITESYNKAGRIVINVCVDATGQVISARFTPQGSTRSDSDLIAIATKNAKKWKFSSSEASKQCGTITYTFKLR